MEMGFHSASTLCIVYSARRRASFAAHKWRGPALSSTVSVIQYTLQRLITSLIKCWVATKPVGVSLAPAGGHRGGSLAGLCCRQPIAGASSG